MVIAMNMKQLDDQFSNQRVRALDENGRLAALLA
jgi:hypothetical protein